MLFYYCALISIRAHKILFDYFLQGSFLIAFCSFFSSLEEAKWSIAHLFFYLADEGGNILSVGPRKFDFHDGALLASGSRKDVGSWELYLKSSVWIFRFTFADSVSCRFSYNMFAQKLNVSELLTYSGYI